MTVTEEYPPQGPDTSPAVVGLVLAVIAIFVVLFSIVMLTNSHYEHNEAAPAAQHAP
jgi:hypothetical protein